MTTNKKTYRVDVSPHTIDDISYELAKELRSQSKKFQEDLQND